MLNTIWAGMILIACALALLKAIFLGQADIFVVMMRSLFDSAKTGFEISLGLAGVMSLWLGIMRIAEEGGALAYITRVLSPLLRRLMPEVPAQHPAQGAVTMNLAANALGLDNAATPLGLNAMRELQTLNPQPDTATNAMILFLVLNASSVTLLPLTVFTYRAQMGAQDPTDVFVPILIATYFSTLVGLVAVAVAQRINLFNRVIMAYLVGITLLVAAMAAYFGHLPAAEMQRQSALFSNALLFAIVMAFLVLAVLRRVKVFEVFVQGAAQGFQVAISIIPYLVGMLLAIGLLRASGALDSVLEAIRSVVIYWHGDTRFVDALPTALMKPFSGSGARAMMIETMRLHGADSFAGRLSAIIQGSTETTFYVLAVYFGSVGITRSRHAISCALLADLAGVLAAIAVCYAFFG